MGEQRSRNSCSVRSSNYHTDGSGDVQVSTLLTTMDEWQGNEIG